MDLAPSDFVVEVGPGRGVLTEQLAARLAPESGRLVAVEVDSDLAEAARARFAGDARVEIEAGNFLDYPIPAGARVAANLPFAITADAVRHITSSNARDAHLIVQREAAQRFAGAPRARETLPSLLLKPWWHIEVLRDLRPTDFDPPPSVESVYLWLAHRDPPLVHDRDAEAYRAVVEAVFGRADTLGRGLTRIFTRSQVDRLRRELGLDLDAAPSTASFDRWLAIFRAAQALDRLPSDSVPTVRRRARRSRWG
jgi:16S rRNA (adenine1518-N6/adenine1519-N6)-dimethyltransferase